MQSTLGVIASGSFWSFSCQTAYCPEAFVFLSAFPDLLQASPLHQALHHNTVKVPRPALLHSLLLLLSSLLVESQNISYSENNSTF